MACDLAILVVFFQDEVAQGDLDGTKSLLGHSLVSGLPMRVPKGPQIILWVLL
jgi:hypothetical protein